MNLAEILKSIKEQNLSKGKLEEYEQDLASLYATMMMRIGELKKEKAIYILERTNPETPDIKNKRLWEAGTKGQELIELEANVKAASQMMRSVRARIYQQY